MYSCQDTNKEVFATETKRRRRSARRYGRSMTGSDHPSLDHGDLRSAIEYAVLIAAEGRRRRPPLAFPDELKPFLDGQHLSRRSLGKLRRAIDAASDFRKRLAATLELPEAADLVDAIGFLWLTRPEGWQADVNEALSRRDDERRRRDDERQARKDEKRRLAAEEARERLQTQLGERDARIEQLRSELDDVRTRLASALEEAAEQRIELGNARLELRHTRDRERAALNASPPPTVIARPPSSQSVPSSVSATTCSRVVSTLPTAPPRSSRLPRQLSGSSTSFGRSCRLGDHRSIDVNNVRQWRCPEVSFRRRLQQPSSSLGAMLR